MEMGVLPLLQRRRRTASRRRQAGGGVVATVLAGEILHGISHRTFGTGSCTGSRTESWPASSGLEREIGVGGARPTWAKAHVKSPQDELSWANPARQCAQQVNALGQARTQGGGVGECEVWDGSAAAGDERRASEGVRRGEPWGKDEAPNRLRHCAERKKKRRGKGKPLRKALSDPTLNCDETGGGA